MSTITDEFIREVIPTAKPYCVFILKTGPKAEHPEAGKIQWEHVRRNFQLRADGILSVVLPVMDETEVQGVGVLNTSDLNQARTILDEDPNVKAGIFTYEVHSCIGFPGDQLP